MADIPEWTVRVGERVDVGFPLFSPDNDTWALALTRLTSPTEGIVEEGIEFQGSQGRVWLRLNAAGRYQVKLTMQTVVGREKVVEFYLTAE